MKRYFAIILILAAGTFSLLADELSVTSGNFKRFKSGGNIYATLDFEGATFDNKHPLTEEYSDFDKLTRDAADEMREDFNDEARRCRMVADSTSAQFSMHIKINKIDSYIQPFSWTGMATVTKMWGVVKVTDLATGETICTFEIDELDGGRNNDYRDSFCDAFEELGEQIANRVNRAR
ncbi:MAG: hypothetical protein NC418_03590 [Muribaculaceae bacterium]|nr:hypothetical protein [Muribaculaceae bacterium]